MLGCTLSEEVADDLGVADILCRFEGRVVATNFTVFAGSEEEVERGIQVEFQLKLHVKPLDAFEDGLLDAFIFKGELNLIPFTCDFGEDGDSLGESVALGVEEVELAGLGGFSKEGLSEFHV